MGQGEGFLLNLTTLAFFFRVCRRYKIEGREERISLMRRLVKRNEVKYIPHPAEYLKGRNVTRIDSEEHNDNGNL